MTIVGHPFDTTKVRMQASSTQYASTLACLRQTVATEGVPALYNGLPPSLLTTFLTSGLRFGLQSRFNAWCATRFGGGAAFGTLPLRARVLSEGGGGAACGLFLPLVSTPLELVKCRRQALPDGRATTARQIARGIWREGGLRGLYAGHSLTTARSVLGNAALFGSYEAFQAGLRGARGGDGGAAGGAWADRVCAGVLSGWTTQLVVYPIDAAKSRLQVRGGGGGLVPGLVELWRERALYRGLSAMLLRAVPVHMLYLPSYTLLVQLCASSSWGAAGGVVK